MHVVFSSNSWGTSSGYNAKIHVSESIHVVEPGASGYCTCYPEICPTSLGFANTTSCCQSVDVSCGFADVEVGLLLSPNYPNNYQNNLECAHQLSTEPGKMITVEFESFSVSCVSKYKNLQKASED